jgi:hypothetical protein
MDAFDHYSVKSVDAVTKKVTKCLVCLGTGTLRYSRANEVEIIGIGN